jgi:hypothetical protein
VILSSTELVIIVIIIAQYKLVRAPNVSEEFTASIFRAKQLTTSQNIICHNPEHQNPTLSYRTYPKCGSI